MRVLVLTLLLGACAHPQISTVAGDWTHGGVVVISGKQFGGKLNPAPVVWDDATGANLLDKWTGAWPNTASDPIYNTAYRAPIRGVEPPHAHATRYIAGAGVGGDATSGNAVSFWKTRTIWCYPAFTYASWYQRADPNWPFGGADSDNNYKQFDYNAGTEPYSTGPAPDYQAQYFYISYNPAPAPDQLAGWHVNDAFYPYGLNGDTTTWWGKWAASPMARWSKIELEIRYDKSDKGYIKVWENGRLALDYRGRSDGYPGNQRTEDIGGYQREHSPDAWRYWSDVYLDYTLARVVLGNASTLDKSTIREVQLPLRWSRNLINLRVNLGKFAAGQTAWVYVVTAAGVASAGFPVAIAN